MTSHNYDKALIAPIGMVGLTILTGAFLVLPNVNADDSVVSTATITVPVSCTMSGTGMNSHTASIENGRKEENIGTTNIKAFCNDSEGFSIYAVGFTGDTIGNTYLRDTTLGQTDDILTSTTLSGNTSAWAMKLGATSGTYTPIIAGSTADLEKQAGDTDYSDWAAVPASYQRVAYRNSATDVDNGNIAAEGAQLTATYAAYISPTQKAGTYVGKVKYTLIHPSFVDENALGEAVTLVFSGEGISFPNNRHNNTVKYTNVCKPSEYGYMGELYQELMTPNIMPSGVQNGSYTDDDYDSQTITINGADKIGIEVKYGITANTAVLSIMDGNWETLYYEIYDEDNNISGINKYLIDGDTVNIVYETWGASDNNYDYGFHVKVYPVYNEATTGATYQPVVSECSIKAISGQYIEPANWGGKWRTTLGDEELEFLSEAEINSFLFGHYDALKGLSLAIEAPLTFDGIFIANNKSKLNGYYQINDLNGSMCESVAVGDITTVIDPRDNNTYKIAKLKDGKCWMLENLRLDPTSPTVASNMNVSNTNAPLSAINNYLNGGNSGDVDGWTNVAVVDWEGTDFDNVSGYTEPRIINSFSDTLVTGYGPSSVGGKAKTGVFYNFCAASVGTFCYEREEAYPISPFASIEYDVCPANWQIPNITYVSENDTWHGGFYDLYKQYDDTLEMSDPNSFTYNLSLPLSGFYDYFTGTIGFQNERNSYWTNSASISGYVRVFGYDIDSDTPHEYSWWANGNPNDGLSLRCHIK